MNTDFNANTVDIDYLKANYKYDSQSGIIYKLRNDGNYYEIGFKDSRGYLAVLISNITIKAHRIAWALHHGSWPEVELDHINRNKLDNSISNLRLADRYINNQNRLFIKSARKKAFEDILSGVDPNTIKDIDTLFPYSFKYGLPGYE